MKKMLGLVVFAVVSSSAYAADKPNILVISGTTSASVTCRSTPGG